MNNFALDIWYDEGKKCTFYTIRLLDDNDCDTTEENETDKFFDKYTEDDHPHKEAALGLFRLITGGTRII